jgi:lipopolysaccharide transport system ATP-binding protein
MSSEQPRPAQGDTAIAVANLSKEFRFYDHPTDRLKELLTANQRQYHKIKRALSDVSFTVRHGETVGVMGRNGAGKTTLLSILTGTMAPTSGTVDVYGRVGAILGLGIGFLPQYSGRENLRNGLIALGTAPADLKRKEADVIEFSELGAEIDNPLRTYSSGMTVRLGFSLAISTEPDILIVDEALGVGDALFQHKCQRAIRAFMEQGKTLFFVSHNTGLLESVCNRGIVLRQGQVCCDDDITTAVRQYRLQYFGDETVFSMSPKARAWGDPDAHLVRVSAAGAKPIGPNLFEVHQGELLRLTVTVRTPRPIEQLGLGVVVRTVLGEDVCASSSIYSREPFPSVPAGEFSFEMRIPFRMEPGMYALETSVADMATHPPRLLHIWTEPCTVRVISAGHAIRGMVDPGIEFIYDSKVYALDAQRDGRSAEPQREHDGHSGRDTPL